MNVRPLMISLGVAVVVFAAEARAQCVFESTVDLDPPLMAEAGSHQLKSAGTFDCGPLGKGTSCSSGVLNGSCSENRNTTFDVDCLGACTADFGNGTDAVACVNGPSDEIGRGKLAGECRFGACLFTGGNDRESATAVALVDPGDVAEGAVRCSPGGEGVARSTSRGVLIVTPRP